MSPLSVKNKTENDLSVCVCTAHTLNQQDSHTAPAALSSLTGLRQFPRNHASHLSSQRSLVLDVGHWWKQPHRYAHVTRYLFSILNFVLGLADDMLGPLNSLPSAVWRRRAACSVCRRTKGTWVLGSSTVVLKKSGIRIQILEPLKLWETWSVVGWPSETRSADMQVVQGDSLWGSETVQSTFYFTVFPPFP